MSALDNLSDEIESILFIAREVMGESFIDPFNKLRAGLLGCYLIKWAKRCSLPSPPSYFRIRLQSFRMERREFYLEREVKDHRTRIAMRNPPRGGLGVLPTILYLADKLMYVWIVH